MGGAGMAVEDVASRIGVGVDMIYRYERGTSSPNLVTLSALADCYGMQLGDMFPSSQARSKEIAPILTALHDIDPEDRAELIDDAAALIRRYSLYAKRRELRLDITAPEPSKVIPSQRLPDSAAITETLLTNNRSRRGSDASEEGRQG